MGDRRAIVAGALLALFAGAACSQAPATRVSAPDWSSSKQSRGEVGSMGPAGDAGDAGDAREGNDAGDAAIDGVATIFGDSIGDAHGFGGLGVRGTGAGGGGTGEGTIGLGNIGTMGHGPGTGTSSGHGELRDPSANATDGGMLPSQIRAVVNAHARAVQRCFAQAGAAPAAPQGGENEQRVRIHWVIGPRGRVVDAGVAEAPEALQAAGDCLVRAVRTWRFPRPEGGGVVRVTYPFTFRSP